MSCFESMGIFPPLSVKAHIIDFPQPLHCDLILLLPFQGPAVNLYCGDDGFYCFFKARYFISQIFKLALLVIWIMAFFKMWNHREIATSRALLVVDLCANCWEFLGWFSLAGIAGGFGLSGGD